ncbi:MAG: transposase, partial [Acidobacteriaceae bacterium]
DPLAGKSTLNRLELSGGSKRYHKIDYAPEKIDALLCDLFIESHAQPPSQIVLDLDATDIPLYGRRSRSALVRISARRVWLEMNSFYPWKHIYARACDALRC